MGIVYHAIDKETQEEVVLKLLLGDLQKQQLMVDLFEESARVQQSLQHPNIAPILRVGQEENTSFIVQPYYAKGSLDRWFRQIDINIVVQAFRLVCYAVQFAHERGQIHGDIKPSNILIDADGQILLTDFMSLRSLSRVLISSGIRWGTPSYMAPEILVSAKPPDAKTDIYSLGIFLFEAIKGYLPRQLDERLALASRIQAEIPLALDPKYNWINEIINRSININPSRRFSSVKDIIAAIQEPELEYEWPDYMAIYASAWLEFADGRPNKDLGVSTYSIGSGEYCDFVIRVPDVSEQHAEIEFRDGVFLMRRVNGKATLYLNDEPIRVARILHNGDQIRISNIRIRFAFPKREITAKIVPIQLLPVGWLIKLGEGDQKIQVDIGENSIRIVDQGDTYVEIQSIVGRLYLSTSSLTDEVLVNQVTVNKAELFEGDIIEWQDIRWRVHYARGKWMEVIDGKLLRYGEVSKDDLFEIPLSCRLIAMREYAAERSYLDISFSKDMEHLHCNDIQRLQLFRQLWADSLDTFGKRIGIEVAAELVALIKEKLFISQSAIKSSGKLGSRYSGFMVFPLAISPLVQGLNLPETVPLVLAKCGHFFPDDSFSLLQAVKSLNPMPRLAMIVFLDDTTKLLMLDAITQLQQVQAIDVLALGREEIQRILFARDPRRTLRTGLLANINLLTVSPFIITGSVPDTIFFGREYELRVIADHIATASYAVIGGRRIGKSSLLGRLHKVRLPTAGFCALYYDCSNTPTYETFLAASIEDWQPEAPPHTPATFGDLLQTPPKGKPLVLLLDEADKLIPTDRAQGWRLFNTLRAFANSGRGQIVLSGERTLREALRDPQSPLFNFVNEMILGPLDFRAVEELITRPMKQLEIELVEESQIVKRIWDFTSGHPNIVQRLCSHLIERLNVQGTRRITLDEVDAVINDPGFQEEDFLQTYWEQATPLERIISLLMAQDTKPYRLQDVLNLLAAEDLQPEPEMVKAALDRLVDLRSILKRRQVGYEFALTAFPLVLANTTTAEDLLIVLKNQYHKDPPEVAE